ncbi:ankyrin repeat domain-containing protein [Burkholderia cepacia]|uniref:ankyrin repeat domain-containing protein n=1 Tax=Burkholderia cepacia TaxID=292 RepID=UPI003C7BB11F
MFIKRIAIIGSFALTTLTSAVAAADGGALEGRLRSAADRGDAGEVRTLLERGAPIDSRDGQGRTALLLATHGNHVEAARVLIDAGAGGGRGRGRVQRPRDFCSGMPPGSFRRNASASSTQ